MNNVQKNSGRGRSLYLPTYTRRDVLAGAAAVVGAAALPRVVQGQAGPGPGTVGKVVKNGRIKQSICSGCLGRTKMDREQIAKLLVEMGLVGRDLMGKDEWPTLKQYGLVATMVPGAGSIKQGLNNKSMHAKFLEEFKTNIKAAAEYKWPNVITMAGDRAGISDAEGMDNCQAILKEAVKIAEDAGVTICMEMLNSKVNHAGYMCDHYVWAFELCKRVNSPRFKMLFDIYHMQIMDGDLIATIKKNIQYIGHFHTAGVPGRHELDENQEIYYPAVMRAIVETGYPGYVAHEYSPVRDPIQSLVQAVKACDV
ncbi:MAG: TIM barrel protein [Phycisphaerae bacterium]|nr:TIM barrel protein [Phycisphaerae bacterium]